MLQTVNRKKNSKIEAKDLNNNLLTLSIQLSLDGFCFYITNPNSQKVLKVLKEEFATRKTDPKALLDALERFIFKEDLGSLNFKSVEVIHHNNLISIVPNDYFDENKLGLYLQNTIKLYASDYISYDPISSIDAQAVYLPFVNINNYILDKFGAFEYQHASARLIEKLSLISGEKENSTKDFYLNLNLNSIEIIVFEKKKLVFFNNFDTRTKEDVVYYTLFALEQLQIDPRKVLIEFINRDLVERIEVLKSYVSDVKCLELNPI
jgi:hypothetical protein